VGTGQKPMAGARDDCVHQYVDSSRPYGPSLTAALMTESLWTCFSYLQVWSMHEIISTFDSPGSDMAYARLMCWGLFIGQSAECIVQAYSWWVCRSTNT